MMMRPRKYSTMNRLISKSIGHSINQYYRNKPSSKQTSNNSDTEAAGCFTVFLIIAVIFMVLNAMSKCLY